MRRTAFRLTLLASTVAVALSAQAAPTAADRIAGTDLIPREALFGNPERANVQISPDGKYLSWVAAVGGVVIVWVGPPHQPAPAQAPTGGQREAAMVGHLFATVPGQRFVELVR